tara:strand:- start:284 stop:1381 length:1098 start_codon:yes stop_codon:yes gene_type:complete
MVSREQLSSDLRTRTRQVLQNPNLFRQFPQSQLQQLDPRFAGATSFLPTGVPNPYAGAFQQQRTPGAQYVNYERAAPNVGGSLTQPQPPAGFVPEGTQPEVISVYPDGSPVPDTIEEETDEFDPNDPDQIEKRQKEFLDEINNERMERGLDPFNTFQDYINDQIGPIGMYGGGIASLNPMMMSEGGIMSTLGNIASGIGSGIRSAAQGIGGFLERGMENYRANQAKAETNKDLLEKDPKTMTREELIELINMLQGKSSSGMGAKPKGDPGFQPKYGKDQLDLVSMSEGGNVDFPRMNGPISGPGTETSDDIPAMLSDGEFVVNAKAVRGIGRLKGAGKTKAEQRKEGARMMYALQNAGEKAMRKA